MVSPLWVGLAIQPKEDTRGPSFCQALDEFTETMMH